MGRPRTRMVMSVAAAVTAAVTALPADAQRSEDPIPAELERHAGLLSAQDSSDPLAVGGQIEGSSGGIVLMEVLPSQEARSEMKVGDSYQQVLVAAAQVNEEGNYGVRLDPKAAVLGSTDNYLLTYLDQSRDQLLGNLQDMA